MPFRLKRSKRDRNLSFLQKLVSRYLRDLYARDLLLNLELEAMRETIDYIKQHMSDCMIYTRWHDLHRDAIRDSGIEGLYLEFGVKKGDTIREIAEMTSQPLHGFDSFQGLPENWTGTSLRKGRFGKQGTLPRVPERVTLHKGWFDETLPLFIQEHTGPIAYMHIDCDLYSSTKTIFKHLGNRIVPGTVIVFDEYFNYPNWQQHEYRAFREFVSENDIRYEYMGFLSHDSCVSVKITGKN